MPHARAASCVRRTSRNVKRWPPRQALRWSVAGMLQAEQQHAGVG
jgi:hypothetical protein